MTLNRLRGHDNLPPVLDRRKVMHII